MAQAKQGDVVAVNYTGRLKDGTVFDSNEGGDPLSFTLGTGQVIAGFDEAVTGMEVGEVKTATIPSDDAYGARREDMVFTVERDRLPSDLNPEVGQELQLRTQDNQAVPVLITGLTETGVTIDANHPLAGVDLIFEIELVGIE